MLAEFCFIKFPFNYFGDWLRATHVKILPLKKTSLLYKNISLIVQIANNQLRNIGYVLTEDTSHVKTMLM